MDMIRRNTDYAFRAMANLAANWGKGPVSTRDIAAKEDISYQLTCKIMQRLTKAKLVKSSMGVRGGFELNKKPSKINLLEVINIIQGPLKLNRCLLGLNRCDRSRNCPISAKFCELQEYIEDYLTKITLEEVLKGTSGKKKNGRKK